jgi:hypothetical protein
VNGNGTRLERVKKKTRRENEEKEIVRKRYALDGRQAKQEQKKTRKSC